MPWRMLGNWPTGISSYILSFKRRKQSKKIVWLSSKCAAKRSRLFPCSFAGDHPTDFARYGFTITVSWAFFIIVVQCIVDCSCWRLAFISIAVLSSTTIFSFFFCCKNFAFFLFFLWIFAVVTVASCHLTCAITSSTRYLNEKYIRMTDKVIGTSSFRLSGSQLWQRERRINIILICKVPFEHI